MNKSILRKEFLVLRNSLSQEEIKNKSQKIFDQLFSLPLYHNANTIMTYVSIGSEVHTHLFIQRAMNDGKRIVIPVCIPDTKEFIISHVADFKRDLEKGHWGLLEPKKETLRPLSSDEVDLILVPGVSFTEQGLRLGYGGGYYDRFLSSLQKHIPTVALTFELQIVSSLPNEPHDISMDYIISEKRIYKNL